MRIHYVPISTLRPQTFYGLILQHITADIYSGPEFKPGWFDAFMFGPDVIVGGDESQLDVIEKARRIYPDLPFYFYGIRAERPPYKSAKFDAYEWAMHLNESHGVWAQGEYSGDILKLLNVKHKVAYDLLAMLPVSPPKERSGFAFVVEATYHYQWRESYFMHYLLPRAISYFDDAYLVSSNGFSRSICEEFQAKHELNAQIRAFDHLNELVEFVAGCTGLFTSSHFMASIAQVARTPLTGYAISGSLTDKLYTAGAQLIPTDIATPPEILAAQVKHHTVPPRTHSPQLVEDSVNDFMRSIKSDLSPSTT